MPHILHKCNSNAKDMAGGPFVKEEIFRGCQFGFISLVIFGAFSWFIAPEVRPLVEQNSGIRFPGEWPVWMGNAVLAFAIFVLLFAFAMTLVAALTGPMGDPHDVRTSTRRRRRR